MAPRIRWFSATVALIALTSLARADARPPYEIVSSIPSVMDGKPLHTFMFDRTSKELFAGNAVGLYSVDLTATKPKVHGPIAKGIMAAVDVAPDLGRVFYAAVDEIGYVSERGGPPVKISDRNAWDLVYEPTQHEVYASFEHLPQVLVFDAQTGALKTTIELPGWNAFELEAAPGTVFMMVGGKDGLFTIDAKTHVVSPWEVKGSFITPGELQVDPKGQYLFMARTREIDAVNIATHTVIGRVQMFGTPSIGFDPDSRTLIATWPAVTRADEEIVVYRPEPTELTFVSTLKNQDAGRTGVVRTNRGFVQAADLRFLIWSATRAGNAHP